jgi:hypothetical protein
MRTYNMLTIIRGRWGVPVTLLVGLSLLVLLVACQAEPTPEPSPVADTEPPPATTAPTEPLAEPTEEPQPEPEPEPTPLPDQSAIFAAWEGSPHANTYDHGKGPNTYCARCKSPQNWDPTSRPGPPPNCITCHFAHEEEMRFADTMEYVAEEDWMGITCESCHQMSDGVALPGLAWLNAVTMEHEPVNTPNQLCEKCHVTTQGVRVSGGTGVDHGIVLGGSAHINWAGAWPQADRPQYCSDCHDPHSTVPKQCVDCHTDVLTLDTHIKGFNAAHTNVDCLACHDADGMDVGHHPDEDMGGLFTTVVTSVSRTGDTTSSYVKSHSIQWNVSCDRCHFVDNPWELMVLTADGQVPPEEEDED